MSTPICSKRKVESIDLDVQSKVRRYEEPLDLEGLLEVLDEELIKENDTPLWQKTRIEAALNQYSGDFKELQRYIFFDPLKNYTRNLIATDNKTYAVMLLCWNKTKFSPIHDHPCDGCWVKVVQGTVQEIQYQEKDGKLVESKNLKADGGVLYMNDSIGYHKVGNPSTLVDAITLHVYSPPFEKCRIWLDVDKPPSTAVSCYYSEFGRKNEHAI